MKRTPRKLETDINRGKKMKKRASSTGGKKQNREAHQKKIGEQAKTRKYSKMDIQMNQKGKWETDQRIKKP